MAELNGEITYRTECCGIESPVVQDRDDPLKFHFECPICGLSTTVTAKQEDIDAAEWKTEET